MNRRHFIASSAAAASRGALANWEELRVYLTGLTPFRATLTLA